MYILCISHIEVVGFRSSVHARSTLCGGVVVRPPAHTHPSSIALATTHSTRKSKSPVREQQPFLLLPVRKSSWRIPKKLELSDGVVLRRSHSTQRSNQSRVDAIQHAPADMEKRQKKKKGKDAFLIFPARHHLCANPPHDAPLLQVRKEGGKKV